MALGSGQKDPKAMYSLEHARFEVRGGYYRLCGDVYDNPRFEDGSEVKVNVPVEYNYTTRVVTTRSGSEYQIGSFAMSEGDFWAEVERAIQNGGYIES